MTKKLFFFFLLLMAYEVFAKEPHSLYLTWMDSPESTMTIQWVTELDDQDNQVHYKKINEDTWQSDFAYHFRMPEGVPYLIHRIELKNLQDFTVYQFKIGNEEKIHLFRTMPKELDRPIEFIVGGDMYHGTLDLLDKANKKAASYDPQFVVIGGDIAYSTKGSNLNIKEDSTRWLDWLSSWSKNMISSEGYRIPILVAIGNHEVKGGRNKTPKEALFFYALFRTESFAGYNVIDFGNYMTFVFLDSGHTHPIDGKQTTWLESALSSRKFFPHKFAVYHMPAYPSHSKYHRGGCKDVRSHWVPLFEKYQLHVAFENNEHTYKRSHPILNGKIDPKGVLYMGDGSWSVGNVRKPKTPKQAWYIAKSKSTHNFLRVFLDGKKRHFQSVSPDGVLIDEIWQNN